MAVTGCSYVVAMRERDRRWDEREIDEYLRLIRAQPPRVDGDPSRCVSCMTPLATGAGCRCRVARAS